MILRERHGAEIDTILARYAQRRSAVLPLLYIAQDTYGHLTDEAIREVAGILNLPPTDVFEVVGFYTLFYNRPVGQWVLQVCDDVPCCYCGAEELIAALLQTLGVRENQLTPDGMFLVERVKCLAACDQAPVLQANLDYYYQVTPDKIDSLLNSLRARAAQGGLSVSGRFAEDYLIDGGSVQRIARPNQSVPTTDKTDSGAPEPLAQDTGMQGTAAAQPAEPEPVKAQAAEAESVPEPVEAAAREAAEEQAEAESPVAPSLDRSPAGAHPDPDKQDDAAVPAHAAQQEAPEEKPADAAKADV